MVRPCLSWRYELEKYFRGGTTHIFRCCISLRVRLRGMGAEHWKEMLPTALDAKLILRQASAQGSISLHYIDSESVRWQSIPIRQHRSHIFVANEAPAAQVRADPRYGVSAHGFAFGSSTATLQSRWFPATHVGTLILESSHAVRECKLSAGRRVDRSDHAIVVRFLPQN